MILTLALVVAVTAPAAEASSAPPAPVPTVPPLVVRSLPQTAPVATVDVPVDESPRSGAWASVWPEDAYKARIAGHVILSCDVDRFGIAEWCQVASETPEHRGFGAAALELRPTFKLKPQVGPDGPRDEVVNIAVEFRPPNPQIDWGRGREGGPMGERAGGTNPSSGAGSSRAEFSDITMFGSPLPRQSVSMLNNPVWISTVSYGDFVRAYPRKAGGMDGYAVAHCRVGRKGDLGSCEVIKEDPDHHGFGQAALSLATKFRVSPEWVKAPGHAQDWVDIPFHFPPPGASETRRLTSPYWLSGFDPEQALKVYPPEAAAKGVDSGHGIAKCIVGPDGALTDCAPQEAEPEGLGFSEAAARLASTMRMNPWTAEGAPVDGAVVRVGVRLNLGADGS